MIKEFAWPSTRNKVSVNNVNRYNCRRAHIGADQLSISDRVRWAHKRGNTAQWFVCWSAFERER